jgi:aminoglycoside phosphotransferase (APT) family kinase protein
LHLDLHPANVILTPRGPVVIDWSSARRGEVASAVALTWVIMATSQIDDTGLQMRIVSVLRRLLVATFLRHVDRAAALRRLPAVARFRLGDRNLLASERPAIYALARRAGISL